MTREELRAEVEKARREHEAERAQVIEAWRQVEVQNYDLDALQDAEAASDDFYMAGEARFTELLLALEEFLA